MANDGFVPGFTDAEAAAEAGRRSGEARRRRATMSAEERAMEAITSKLGPLTKELLNAALGEGDFAPRWLESPDGEDRVFVQGLKPETRLTAILRALEWRLGKAPTRKVSEAEPDKELPTAEGLFGPPKSE